MLLKNFSAFQSFYSAIFLLKIIITEFLVQKCQIWFDIFMFHFLGWIKFKARDHYFNLRVVNFEDKKFNSY